MEVVGSVCVSSSVKCTGNGDSPQPKSANAPADNIAQFRGLRGRSRGEKRYMFTRSGGPTP